MSVPIFVKRELKRLLQMNYTKINLSRRSTVSVLALGAQSKSSFCFARERAMYLSGSGGDLSSLEDLKIFEKNIKGLQRRLRIKPNIVACDLHPEYVSSKLARELLEAGGLRLKEVQHHEAHIASCIVDNNVKGDVIGVSFDGTGFGLDGKAWGGEFFIGSIKGFKRAAHLKYLPMPGGEASIKEPWRMGLSYLYSVFGVSFKSLKIDFLKKQDKRTVELLIQIIEKRINSPLTSSIGRLFDAVSAIIGICDVAKHEGQAAIELEKAIKAKGLGFEVEGKYNFKYINNNGVVEIDWSLVIRGLVKDLRDKKSKAEISLKFHNAVCHMIKDVSELIRKKYKINKVCLSGGVFQNKFLVTHVKLILEKAGFELYLHDKVPAHDGGIALGQAALAA